MYMLKTRFSLDNIIYSFSLKVNNIYNSSIKRKSGERGDFFNCGCCYFISIRIIHGTNITVIVQLPSDYTLGRLKHHWKVLCCSPCSPVLSICIINNNK